MRRRSVSPVQLLVTFSKETLLSLQHSQNQFLYTLLIHNFCILIQDVYFIHCLVFQAKGFQEKFCHVETIIFNEVSSSPLDVLMMIAFQIKMNLFYVLISLIFLSGSIEQADSSFSASLASFSSIPSTFNLVFGLVKRRR